MHYGSVRDLLDKKANNLPPSMRLKIVKDAAKGMYVVKKRNSTNRKNLHHL